jgi:drug/metabolite transporter (DMT)-like permease
LKTNPFIKSTTFLAIIACILWATAFVGVKIGLKYNSPLQFAGIRFFISGLLILPFIPNLQAKLVTAWGNKGKIILVGFIQTFLQYALFYSGMNLVPGALGAMIIGSAPLFIALVAHLVMPSDSITGKKLFSILVGLTGVIIISLGRKGMGATGNLVIIGILILVANNILSGFGNILVASDKQKIPPLVLSSFSMIFGGSLLFAVGLAIEGFKTGPFPAEYYISLGWLSFLSAAAFSIWYTLLKRPGVTVSGLNTWKFIIPVLGAILSWAILPDEHPTLIALIGMLLVGLALISLNLRIRERYNRRC